MEDGTGRERTHLENELEGILGETRLQYVVEMRAKPVTKTGAVQRRGKEGNKLRCM